MRKIHLLLGFIVICSTMAAQNIGIGTSTPSYKLHVVGKGYFSDSLISLSLTTGSSSVTTGVSGTGSTYGVYGASSNGYAVYGSSGYLGVYGIGGSYGTYGYSSSGYGTFGSSSSGKGVYGSSSTGYGVYGYGGQYGVYGNGTSYGIWGVSSYLGVYGDGTNYGVYGNSYSGYGVYGNSTFYSGVYGYSSNFHGGDFYSGNNNALWAKTGTPGVSGIYAGVFEGNVYAYGTYNASDKNLKKNIKEFANAMSIINKLQPKSYEFKNDGKYASMNLPRGNHYGLIAQELEEVLPELVANGPHGLGAIVTKPDMGKKIPAAEAAAKQNATSEIPDTKAINYTELIPIIIKGLQEQQLTIDKQQKQMDELLKQMQLLKEEIKTLKEKKLIALETKQ